MILIPQTSAFLKKYSQPVYAGVSSQYSWKTFSVISKPSQEEILFYLQQTIELQYHSNGKYLPKELAAWIKNGFRIDFDELNDEAIKQGIVKIVMLSEVGRNVMKQIFLNLPS